MWKKETILSDEHDNKNKKEQQQQQESDTSNIIVEQIDGTYYTFDIPNCASMFKKFSAVYGRNFADE